MSKAQNDRATRRKNRRLIQQVLDDAGYTQTRLAKELGVSQQAVNGTLIGANSSRRVLSALEKMGVPHEYLFGDEGKAA